jgi:hypothetical protein
MIFGESEAYAAGGGTRRLRVRLVLNLDGKPRPVARYFP